MFENYSEDQKQAVTNYILSLKATMNLAKSFCSNESDFSKGFFVAVEHIVATLNDDLETFRPKESEV